MKIGILTFHGQLNYGGVLQCWALKTAREEVKRMLYCEQKICTR